MTPFEWLAYIFISAMLVGGASSYVEVSATKTSMCFICYEYETEGEDHGHEDKEKGAESPTQAP